MIIAIYAASQTHVSTHLNMKMLFLACKIGYTSIPRYLNLGSIMTSMIDWSVIRRNQLIGTGLDWLTRFARPLVNDTAYNYSSHNRVRIINIYWKCLRSWMIRLEDELLSLNEPQAKPLSPVAVNLNYKSMFCMLDWSWDLCSVISKTKMRSHKWIQINFNDFLNRWTVI